MILRGRELPATQVDALCLRLMPHSAAALRHLFATGDYDLDTVFVAVNARGDIDGAVMTVDLHGGQVEVWPPAADDATLAEALVIHAVIAWRCRGARVFQSVVRPADTARAAALACAGFQKITSLAFFERALIATDRTVPPTTLTTRPVAVDDAAFADLVFSTYEGGQDVPELNGTRGPAEILAGYRESSTHDPPLWFAVQHHDSDIGVIILNLSRGKEFELTYMGLISAVRGHGWGHELGRIAIMLAANWGGDELRLTADIRNAAAQRVYTQLGFRIVDERPVWLLI